VKRLADVRVNYRYILVEDDEAREKQLEKIGKQLKWLSRVARERFSARKYDVLGREVLPSYVTSYRCLDFAGLCGVYPVVHLNSNTVPFMAVPIAACKACPAYKPANAGRYRRQQTCSLWGSEMAAWRRVSA
jgi:hypothetical protein